MQASFFFSFFFVAFDVFSKNLAFIFVGNQSIPRKKLMENVFSSNACCSCKHYCHLLRKGSTSKSGLSKHMFSSKSEASLT